MAELSSSKIYGDLTVTGQTHVITPTEDTHATTKLYVDGVISTHDHDADYLGIGAKAADSDLLDGLDSTAFSLSGHTHAYSPTGHTHALGDLSNVTATGEGSGGGFDADTVDGIHASGFATSGHNHDAAYVNASGDTMAGALLMGDGSVTAPSLSFSGDTDTGIYRYVSGSARLAFAVDGVQRGFFNSGGLTLENKKAITISTGHVDEWAPAIFAVTEATGVYTTIVRGASNINQPSTTEMIFRSSNSVNEIEIPYSNLILKGDLFIGAHDANTSKSIYFGDTGEANAFQLWYDNSALNFRDVSQALDIFKVHASGAHVGDTSLTTGTLKVLGGSNTPTVGAQTWYEVNSGARAAGFRVRANGTNNEWWCGTRYGNGTLPDFIIGTADHTSTQAERFENSILTMNISGNVTVEQGQLQIQSGTAAAPGLAFDASTNTGIFWGSGNRIEFSWFGTSTVQIGNLFIANPVYDNTTASSANVTVTSAGAMRRSTSSARYKSNIRAQPKRFRTIADKLFQVSPVTFNGKSDESAQEFSGFTAEDLHDTLGDDAHLFVGYHEGSPDWIMYDRLVVPMIQKVKEQEERIAHLETLISNNQS